MQGQRDLEACVFDCLTGDSDSKIFIKMKEHTTAYSKLPQTEREARGSPHLEAFQGALAAMVEEGEAIGRANLEVLQKYQQEVRLMSIEELSEQVRLCRQVRCFDEKQRKLLLEMSRAKPEVRRALLEGLQQLKFRLRQGRAPAGYLERELGSILEQVLTS